MNSPRSPRRSGSSPRNSRSGSSRDNHSRSSHTRRSSARNVVSSNSRHRTASTSNPRHRNRESGVGPVKRQSRPPSKRSPRPLSARLRELWHNSTWWRILLPVAVLIFFIAAGTVIYRAVTSEEMAQSKLPDGVVQAVDIAECRANDVSPTFVGHSATITSGSAWKAELTLTNKGTSDCVTSGAAKDVGLLITSGNTTVVNTATCADAEARKPLLLGVGRSWKTVLSWDGTISSDCTPGEAAKPGTYVATLILGGKPTQVRETIVVK